MTGILQPDGTTCYSGETCRRHSKYNRDMEKTWSVYFDYKKKISEKNWIIFPFVTRRENIPLYVKKRIEEWAVRNGTTYDWAEKIAVTDEEGWRVVVHPEIRRQSWQEDALFKHLSKFEGSYFAKVKQLPKSTTSQAEALTLKNGILVKNDKKVLGDDGTHLKTLDGYVELASTGTIVYIIAKYTEGKGGSQDNQANEALRSLKEQRENNNFIIAAILDGDYYQSKDSKGKTWIDNHKEGLLDNTFIGSHKDFLKAIQNGEMF